jgi:SAM-dependent methyltransferase
MLELERAVVRHYALPELAARVLDGIRAAGLDPERLTADDLAPIDEFHIGGRQATQHALSKLRLGRDQHILDVGCGLGGATRFLASQIGCRVTGIDLTPEYVSVARMLSEKTGLAERVDYRVASALAMPFPDRSFDVAITMHVAMNIADRAALYREVARVVKPGGGFCIYDVMKGKSEGLNYPVPWAETEATSHLRTPEEMRDLLTGSGFVVGEIEDRTEFGIAFFRRQIAAASGGSPPLGIHILMGANARDKLRNMLDGLERGCIAPVVMIATRSQGA